MSSAVPRLAAALALALWPAGCGVGAGKELSGGAELRVTRDFGAERLASSRLERVTEGQTVMRFLQSRRRVDTRFGGNFVQSIDGLAGGNAGGRLDWFYFVNGIEASEGAAERTLRPGDVVQWDYRRWEAAMRVPAIVGAYPEPFLHGSEGKRLPTRVECESSDAPACSEVKRRLEEQDVPVTGAPLGVAAGPEVLRVVVGRWAVVRHVQAASPLEKAPRASGVFARFDSSGALTLLDESGEGGRPAPAGTGLVAATAPDGQSAVWLVTGRDEQAVAAAARAFDPGVLRDAFAVAATPSGPVDLPLRGR